MNKRVIVFCAIIVLVLLCAIGFVSYKLFISPDTKEKGINDSRTDVLYAVPSDAIMIYGFNSFSDIPATLSSRSDFLSKLPEDSKGWASLFSLHYSSKNRVSTLFVLSLPPSLNKDEFIEKLSKECSGISHKKYGATTIYRSIVPNINYSIYNNYLIASKSVVILESSLRHLEGNSSILDNNLFSKMSKNEFGRSSLHINNQNIGKLYSGTVNYGYLGSADFASDFSSWTLINMDCGSNYLFGEGEFLNTKDEANFSQILSLQKSKESDLCKVLPSTTDFLLSLPIYDVEEYLASYNAYLQSHHRALSTSPKQWFLSLGVEEVAVASVAIGGGPSEKVVLMKVKHPSVLGEHNSQVGKFKQKGYISALLGRVFTPSNESSFIFLSDWVVIGGAELLKKYSDSFSGGTFFSFENYLSQTPAAAGCKGVSSLLFMANLDRCRDSIAKVFKGEYSKAIFEELDKKNFNFSVIKIVNDQKKMQLKTSLFLDNLSQLPVSLQIDDTPVIVPKGPFRVKNFINGKTNHLEQQPNNMLRLLDENKKGVWTIPFDKPLCGYVGQIDYFKNGKLQMVFAAGTKLYLLDRLGRWVSSFPIDLRREVLLGPKVYDFKGNREYSFLVLHADNKVVLYDSRGVAVKGWNQITCQEKIRTLPDMIKVGEKNYWVVRTLYQTLIYDGNGVIVADFTKKKRLKADTEVKVKSSKEVIVTTSEDKEMIINLETGAFRKP